VPHHIELFEQNLCSEIGGNDYSVMWAIHLDKRPPLIAGCPEPLERLMTQSWHKVSALVVAVLCKVVGRGNVAFGWSFYQIWENGRPWQRSISVIEFGSGISTKFLYNFFILFLPFSF